MHCSNDSKNWQTKETSNGADLLALAADQGRTQTEGVELEAVQLQYVSNGHQGAVASDHKRSSILCRLSAMVPGAFKQRYNSIDQIFDQQPRLLNYEITALTKGEDAQAEVQLAIECVYKPTNQWDRC